MNLPSATGRATAMYRSRLLPLLATFAVCLPSIAIAERTPDLERGFRTPPASARPWVYWFWLNGNISSNGITADLEAMKRVGIGGVLIMEVDQGAPVGPADFMGAPWRALFAHVHHEAQRLGLEVNMNNDAGWNGSGGPWIRPDQSMQKLVWTETRVTGPTRFNEKLPQPETVAGFYRDIAVLALPTIGTNRIDGIRSKAMFETAGIGAPTRGSFPAESTIPRDRVMFLPATPAPDGSVAWDVPAGNWTLLRLGHTSTGAENAPAPRSGRGLECDKLSPAGIEAQFAAMMEPLAADSGIHPGRKGAGLVATHIDSWENGSQNWTPHMRSEFQRRRGYDLFPFLPVITGRVVGSLEVSERFLWDLRQTVSELVIGNYAGRMRELAHARGMRFTVEAYGAPCDSISYAGRSDEPMGEFWTPSGAIETCKAMASAGHVFGLPIVGAEAFTSGDQERWREHPALLKSHGDRAFCEGINRFVFHRYALQPWNVPDRSPGMMMGPWGQHYERTQTWWDWTPAWHEYLARCQFLLRQGTFVADVCHLLPELPPQGPGDHRREGYDWDECPAELVIEKMSVKNGRLTLPGGMSYRLLVLPDSDAMTPRLLERITELVRQGASILGRRPSFSPSLADYPACDARITRLATELWADCDGARTRERTFGKGRVFCGRSPAQVLKLLGVPPDFSTSQNLRFIHRTGPDFDLYFVANPEPFGFTTSCSFRVTGRIPELWWPDSGRIERAAMYDEHDGITHVVIPFDPSGSVFVAFRERRGHDNPVSALSLDGKPILAARPEPLPTALIQRATYGILEDPRRTRDVTAEVQRRIDAGERTFTVSSLAAAGDPAPNTPKSLSIDYKIDDRTFHVAARDSDPIRVSRNAVNAKVLKARYGILDDPRRTRDVRDRVQRIIDAGETGFVVARMADGDDPAFLVVKTLELELTLDGHTVQLSGHDPDSLQLAPVTAPSSSPVTIQRGSDGVTRITSRDPGQFQWVRASGESGNVTASAAGTTTETVIPGPWTLRFKPAHAEARSQALAELASWSTSTDPALRYHAGTATYSRTLVIPPDTTAGRRHLVLDLGRVEVMARVTLNGRRLTTLWKAPYRVDLGRAARVGENQLEIEVVNLWPNRLVGDEQLPEDSERNPDGTLKQWPPWLNAGQPSPSGRSTFVSWRLWKKSDALLPSGLIGPVTLRTETPIPIGR